MKLPTNLAALCIIAGVVVSGLITGLAWSHNTVPAVLTTVVVALIAGGLGNALPPVSQ